MNKGLFDVHCHMIPEVDDGSDSIETSLQMIRAQYDAGVRQILLTPHYRKGVFEAPRDYVEQRFEELRQRVKEVLPDSNRNGSEDLQLYLGCEYHSCMSMVEELQKEPRYCLNGTRSVLVEFSSEDDRNYLRERVYTLRSSGFLPVIAHVERYPACIRNPELILELKKIGAMIQVNADSILGKEGRKAKKFARMLIKEDLLDFVGSDAHDLKERPSRLKACFDWVSAKYGSGYAGWLFCDHPAELVRQR